MLALSLGGVLALPLPGRSDDEVAAPVPQPPAAPAGDPQITVEPLPTVAAQVPAKPGSAPAPPAEEQPAQDDQPVAKEAAAEPQPIGKLQIRKGTGRPPGQRVNAIAVPALAPPVAGIDFMEARPDLVVPQVDPQELEKRVDEYRQRILTQFRPLLHRELYFVHLVCDTTAAERKQLLEASEAELTKVADTAAKFAVQQDPEMANDLFAEGGFEGGMMVIGQPVRQAASEWEANRAILDALREAAGNVLGDERAAKLRTEWKARTTAQRQGPVDRIVAQLDAFLVLSPQQQTDLREKLLEAWREEWSTLTQNIDARYLPDIQLPPRALLLLSHDQRRRYNSVPRANFAEFHGAVVDAAKPDPWKIALDQLDQAQGAEEPKP